jgi:3-oxoacyl-[acyl-carrier protein] reductase
MKGRERMNLIGRVAVVTGAGPGIGRAIAEAFAREGASVVVNYNRSREAAEDVVRSIRSAGGIAIPTAADVSTQSGAEALMSSAASEFGRLDYLVNNAGWSTFIAHKNLADLTDEIWDRVFDINLRGAFYCVRAAVPLLEKQEGASIVNIASVSALAGVGSSIAYAAAKGAMVTMTKSLARSLAPSIRVNAVLPGAVRTHFAGATDTIYENFEKATPLKRLATVEDVAAAALFFAAMAGGVTGETLVVDGGIAMLGKADV